MKFNFSGKVVMITGGAEKAGKYFATEYARAGADLVITHYRMEEEAAETAKEIEAMGRKCLVVEADNSDVSQLHNVVKQTRESYGRLDVLLHNASNFNNQPIDEVTEPIWNSSFDIILKGAFFLSKEAAPLMLENGGGKILAMIGNSYYENWPDFIPHCIAKIGLAKLMQLLAVTYSPKIQCNAICPASFLSSTDGNAVMTNRGELLDVENSTITVGGITIHRGNEREVAELLMFLSDSSAYMNGAVIPIDGGKNLL